MLAKHCMLFRLIPAVSSYMQQSMLLLQSMAHMSITEARDYAIATLKVGLLPELTISFLSSSLDKIHQSHSIWSCFDGFKHQPEPLIIHGHCGKSHL